MAYSCSIFAFLDGKSNVFYRMDIKTFCINITTFVDNIILWRIWIIKDRMF